MKFAICNETYGKEKLDAVAREVAAVGYDGLEIAPFTLADNPHDLSEAEARQIAGQLRETGVEPVGLHWLLAGTRGLHLTSPDDAVRKATAEYGAHLARFCAAMGGRVMVWGSPKQRSLEPGQDYDRAFAQAAEVVREVCQTAGPLGVEIAMEPLGTAETNFLTTAGETIRFIETVDHPACRLHLDVKAMSAEDKPIPEIIRDSAAHVAHFHANDPNLRGPGFGEVDFAPIAEALHGIGYDRYVSVEVFDYTPDAHTIATESLAYLKRHFGN